MKKLSPLVLLFCLILGFCDKEDLKDQSKWLIPANEVRDGGPGKDGIPAIDKPEFATVDQTHYLQDDDLIIGIKIGDEIRGYTHEVLDYHEIVNDQIGDDIFSVTYCPLTGTAIGWNRVLNGYVTTFGVSGLLYNSNLIPYDRSTDSEWSQMRLECVHGELIEQDVDTYHLIETDWLSWKKFFPDAKVLTTNTGFSRNYGVYPYGNYKRDNMLIFNVNPTDDRLPAKERVLGVTAGGKAKVYRFVSFGLDPVMMIEDRFGGEEYIVVGSKRDNYMMAYDNSLDGKKFDFTPVQNNRLFILEDQEGNQWNLFGEAVNGPRQGQRLRPMESYIGYWFAWGAFYPGAEIFSN